VVTNEYWWTLGDRDRVYEPLFGEVPPDIQYIVVSGNGSGKPGIPVDVFNGKFKRSDYQVVDDRLNRVPASFLGFRMSRGAYGFGAMVLRKIHAAPEIDDGP
jgi:hypothetical protein